MCLFARTIAAGLSICAVLSSGGCAHAPSTATSASTSSRSPAYVASPDERIPGPVTSTREPERLDDDKILTITRILGTSELEQARLAERRASDPRVREAAREAVEDAAEARRSAEQLGDEDRRDRPSALAEQLVTDEKERIDRLRPLQGEEFDRAYVEVASEARQAALEVIDRDLVPNAQRAEVRALLERLRPALADQLSSSRALAEELGPSPLQLEHSAP